MSRASALTEVVLTSGFPTQLAIGLVLAGAGVSAYGADGSLSLRFVATLWLADAVVVVGLVVLFLRLRGERPATLWLGARSFAREAWLGLALVPATFGVAIAILETVRLVWPALHNVAVNPFEGLIRSGEDAAVLAVVAVVSGGIKEELQRGFVLHRFEQQLGGAAVGLVVFSIAFGAGHLVQGWDVGLVTTLLGLCWGVLYLKRRSVTAAAVSHSGFNVAQVVQFVILG